MNAMVPEPAKKKPSRSRTGTRSVGDIPTRFWLAKRMAAAYALLLVALLASRLWWGYQAQQRVAAGLAAIEQRGQPLHWAGLPALAPGATPPKSTTPRPPVCG